MARAISVQILGDASSLERAFNRSKASATGFNTAIGSLRVGLGAIAKSFIVVEALDKAFEGLSGAVGAGIQEFRENATIQAQTSAALKSTGAIAGVTSQQIRDLSLALSNLSGQSDESIRAAENVELSFTNIRNSAGKGNDIFTQATKLIVDFAARTGKDAPAAAVLFGKALEDPAKRVGILARAGVVLSESQVKVLKSTEKTQGILAAQKILIGDLKVRFDGAAAAAGQTLPGALDILKERFRDLAGEGIDKVAEPIRRATVDLSKFVVKLSEAHGFHAKLDVAIAGIENLGRDIFNKIRSAIESVNWRDLARDVSDGLRGAFDSARAAVQHVDWRAIGRTVEDRLKAVNWRAIIQEGAHGLSVGITAVLDELTSALKAVDWSKVGKAIADGLAIAVGATLKFLASLDWGKIARSALRLLEAAFKADAQILNAIGREVGRLLVNAIGKELTAAGTALEKLGLRIALKIVEPFSHLPDLLGGGPFQELKAKMQQELADLGTAGNTSARAAGAQIGSGLLAGLASAADAVGAAFAKIAPSQVSDAGSNGPQIAAATIPQLLPPAPDLLGSPAAKRKGITADQRNTFFDNRISRLLDQASDGSIQQQIAKLKAIGGLITQRISATKDVTRRLTLEQELLDSVTRPLKQLRDQGAQNLLDVLQLGVDRAGATKSVADDLQALAALRAGIQKRIKSVGATVDLEQQLLGVETQITAARQQQVANRALARNASQFLALGLTSTGDARVPGIAALRRALGTFGDAVSGTFLDTSKTKSVLSHIRKVLSGGLGDVGRDVRSKVQQILSDLDQQLKNHAGDQTKFRHATAGGILAGLDLKGLTHEQLKVLVGRVSTIGAGGTVPGGASAAFAGAGGIHFHGPTTITTQARTPAQMKRDLDKLASRSPRVRRGAQ